ncbi:uncharacterized protein RSE6_07246 [Rhynchosporium secalis]|uniref:Protein kinase domain-containing protein n=1 Tax=Rhynchosporium secalis TaxID=38038 RepID=A0A1E1MCC6_RHYSE|nr:uncharacterized protein RSE6_07246 [Rhynchosporium secalis]
MSDDLPPPHKGYKAPRTVTERYNFWLQYNDPDTQPVTRQVMNETYRKHPYARPPPTRPPARPARGTIVGPIFQTAQYTSEEEANLQTYLLENAGPPAVLETPERQKYLNNWKATKILGDGGQGLIGLFEYDPSASDPPMEMKKVVKQVKDGSNLQMERELFMRLEVANSEHIIRFMSATGDDQQIVLEFCPQGDLGDLLNQRIKRWRIFECLVDACSVLEFGRELEIDLDQSPRSAKAFARPMEDWTPIIHFDLKPENVLLGSRTRGHRETPVCKVADFGLALMDLPLNKDERETLRGRGTERYFTPEQFTPRWNCSDWDEGPEKEKVAGIYGSPTNVWGIGAIILVCLDANPPDHRFPFTPGYIINGKDPKGDTYGPAIEAELQYSDELRHMVLECLYERPADRCVLRDMKYNISKKLDAYFDQDDFVGDAWADLDYYGAVPSGFAPIPSPSPPPPSSSTCASASASASTSAPACTNLVSKV